MVARSPVGDYDVHGWVTQANMTVGIDAGEARYQQHNRSYTGPVTDKVYNAETRTETRNRPIRSARFLR